MAMSRDPRACDDTDEIDHMRRDEFVRTVRQAESDANDAVRLREKLRVWALRLLPYLDGDPELTVGQALERFNAGDGRTPT